MIEQWEFAKLQISEVEALDSVGILAIEGVDKDFSSQKFFNQRR